MLATLGVIVAEATTGVAWQDAGKVELDGASYLGLGLPFTVTYDLSVYTKLVIGSLLLGAGAESQVSSHVYPIAFGPTNTVSRWAALRCHVHAPCLQIYRLPICSAVRSNRYRFGIRWVCGLIFVAYGTLGPLMRPFSALLHPHVTIDCAALFQCVHRRCRCI